METDIKYSPLLGCLQPVIKFSLSSTPQYGCIPVILHPAVKPGHSHSYILVFLPPITIALVTSFLNSRPLELSMTKLSGSSMKFSIASKFGCVVLSTHLTFSIRTV